MLFRVFILPSIIVSDFIRHTNIDMNNSTLRLESLLKNYHKLIEYDTWTYTHVRQKYQIRVTKKSFKGP